ncbi:hypothetical protein GCM10022226_09070 [Sphaerisporangium flaviroseum]|uniref:Uncharacterized protein n=1 Tax=Sphaerisporangium flaviroseum TaxID=509199 RepID=A0ABP7HLZ2_9ACTN
MTQKPPSRASVSRSFGLVLPGHSLIERYLNWIKNNLIASGFTSVQVDAGGLRTEDPSSDRVVLSIDRGFLRSHVRYEVYGPEAEEYRLKLLAWHYEFEGSVAARGTWWHMLLYLVKWLVMVSVPLVATVAAWYITHR